MAVSARLWFHFCTAVGWFPAALNLFLATAIRSKAPEANFKLKSHGNKAPSDFPAEAAALQFRPLDASGTCSSGQLMVPMDPRTKEIHIPYSIFAVDSGQLMVPTAANLWSL